MAEILNFQGSTHRIGVGSFRKLIITLARVEKYQTTVKNKEQKKVLELQLKAEIIRTILKDYYWLRQQLQLKESENESEKIETGEFISIR